MGNVVKAVHKFGLKLKIGSLHGLGPEAVDWSPVDPGDHLTNLSVCMCSTSCGSTCPVTVQRYTPSPFSGVVCYNRLESLILSFVSF